MLITLSVIKEYVRELNLLRKKIRVSVYFIYY